MQYSIQKNIYLTALILVSLTFGCEKKQTKDVTTPPALSTSAPPGATAPATTMDAPAQKSDDPKSLLNQIEYLYPMATFFSAALDDSLKNENLLKNYCDIKPEQITLYSMAIKARIDDWMMNKKFSQLPDVQLCAQNCICDLYIDLSENILPEAKKRNEVTQTAKALQKKQSASACLKLIPDFCQSKEFQILKTEVLSH